MGTHYLMTPDYSLNFALNELTLILIGTGLALGMNWLMPSYRKKIREDVKTAEQGMKRVLTEMAGVSGGEEVFRGCLGGPG